MILNKVLRFHALLLGLLLLAGCGFQLKMSAQLPASFGPVSIEGIGSGSTLYRSIKNILRGSDIRIVEAAEANNRIIVRQTKNDRKTLSVDANGKVSEYELIRGIDFSVIDNSGNTTIENQSLIVSRYYTVNNDQALSDDIEEADIRRLMDEELADRMFRYISAQAK